MSFWRRSLTYRLVCLFVLVSSNLLIGLGLLTLSATNEHFLELDEVYLYDKGLLVQEIAQNASSSEEVVKKISHAFNSQPDLSLAIFDRSKVLYNSPGFEFSTLLLNQLGSQSGAAVQWLAGTQTMRAVSIPVDGLTVVLAVNTLHHDHFMSSFRALMWGYVAVAIVLSGLLGWWVTRRGLRPLLPIIVKASHINAAQLNDRIPTQDVPTELQPLARTLNQMLERLEQDFARLSGFSSDLAHEIRTPISNMLIQSQVTLSKKRSTDQYQETLLSVVEELERLSSTVSDMLYLAKTENHLEVPNQSSVVLESEAVELLTFYELLAEEKGVTLTVAGNGTVKGDRLMIRRAISNLLSNAIRHADSSTHIAIEITQTDLVTTLSISNTGETIPIPIQLRIFDRFFRSDQGRTHPNFEGAGLGLAITKAIMQAHGGSIGVSSEQRKTVFTLLFL
jgi:two-component system, OmpR family, heavy metal sensor histidine kinase CusS